MAEHSLSKHNLPYGRSLLSYRVEPVQPPCWPVADVRLGVDMVMTPWTIASYNYFLPSTALSKHRDPV